jgi:hypothetical protein
MFWDLVYVPQGSYNHMFDDAASASNFETMLKPIQATGTPSSATTGWYCPSGDGTRPCRLNMPPGAICMQVSDSQTGTTQYCSGDRDLKGLALRQRDDTPAINVMSLGYAPPMPDAPEVRRRPPTLSLSQIEQIKRVLTDDIDTPIRDARGQIIWGGRPRLGL